LSTLLTAEQAAAFSGAMEIDLLTKHYDRRSSNGYPEFEQAVEHIGGYSSDTPIGVVGAISPWNLPVVLRSPKH